jgi:hypothetical protein|tara:strand:+ start:2464 stop:2844 length:381 start_codon:yes stop_codon:yes gene_type:complete
MIFYISIPNSIESKPMANISCGKKLWYDIESKKMIEVDGDLSFNYNYKESKLNVSGKNYNSSKDYYSLNKNNSILDQLKRDFNIEVLSKSMACGNVEVTVELLDSSQGSRSEFQNALDHYRVRYWT